MSTRCYESVVSYRVGLYDIRVWRTEEAAGECNQSEIEAWISGAHERAMFDTSFNPSAKEILETLAEFPDVAAVEVIDAGKCSGVLLYTSWP